MTYDFSKLNLVIENKRIKNLDEILAYIETLELDFNLYEYLETLTNKLKYSDVRNKQKLITLINKKLLQFALANKKEEEIIQEDDLTLNEETYDLSKLKELIIKRNIYETNLNEDEAAYINKKVGYLLDTMLERVSNNDLASEEQCVLDDYIVPLIELYKEKPNDVTFIELQQIERYLDYKKVLENKELDKKEIVPKLQQKKYSSGIASIVILLEIVLLGMITITFLSLDI